MIQFLRSLDFDKVLCD